MKTNELLELPFDKMDYMICYFSLNNKQEMVTYTFEHNDYPEQYIIFNPVYITDGRFFINPLTENTPIILNHSDVVLGNIVNKEQASSYETILEQNKVSDEKSVPIMNPSELVH